MKSVTLKTFLILMVLLPFESTCNATDDLNENWNPDIGLWYSEQSGHTFATDKLEKVHSGVIAASRLLNAAVLERLNELDVSHALEGLRGLQDLDPKSKTYGCMRWYAEDTSVDDTNAAFFIGLPLIVLKSQYSNQLDAASLALLDEILGDLKTWFTGAVYDHPRVYYPNKFMGDLVCAWLITELMEDTDQMPSLAEEMLDSARYWTKHGWGWGEHMSDGYAGVCLNELSLLLCLSEALPQDVEDAYTGLMNDLLLIEDLFGGDPRVPAVRSYAFTRSPEHQNYRDKVREWNADELLARKNSMNLVHILNTLNWHDRVAPRKPQGTQIRVNCFNNNSANAWLEDDVRVGSLSAFPLMPTAEHKGWGLAWQSFPVAMWKPEGDWAFLQWMVQKDGEQKAHPANGWKSAYLDNALSKSVSPPIVGQTYALQHKGNILVLRILPATDLNWDWAGDQFRIINNNAEVNELPKEGPWSQLLLTYPKRQISINHVDLMGNQDPVLQENDINGYDWRVTWSNKDMQAPPANELGKHMLIGIWGISIDGEITSPPELLPLETVPMQRNPEQRAYVLNWSWPGINWHVEIDPMNKNPLMNPLPLEAAYPFKHLKELPKPDADGRYGEHIKRTMHLLSTSTEERPNKVKILFYGQSITRQDYSRKIIEAQLRKEFPSAQLEVLNPAIGGYEAARSVLTMQHTLIPEQPDLVVFHVYGGEEDGTYEEILKLIREQTSAELVCVTHHLDNYVPSRDPRRDEASELRRQLARKYDAELVDVREEWRRYIELHDLERSDLLADGIHHNPHGGELWGALQARHFQVQPASPADWEDRIQRIRLPDKATLNIPFEGTRVDAISHTGSGQAEIRVDGKRPSELLNNWAATLPSPTPIDYRPAIMRVMLHGKPIEETWTVTIESCSDDGEEYSFSVHGSVSGYQGKGDNTGVFHSKNGVIELRPDWFTLNHAIQIKKTPLPIPFDVTWEVYPMVPDVWKLSPDKDNPSGQTTLIQCLPQGGHELEINLVEGDLSLEELLIYRYAL